MFRITKLIKAFALGKLCSSTQTSE